MRRWLHIPDGCARPGELGLAFPHTGLQVPWVLDTPPLPGPEGSVNAFGDSPNAYLDSLPGYNQSEGPDLCLEWARLANAADRYIPKYVTFPAWEDAEFPLSGETKQGSFSVPAYSLLLSIACAFLPSPEKDPQFQACQFRLMDKGAVTELFNGTWALSTTQAGDNTNPGTAIDSDEPYGPFFLRSPHSVCPPGEFNWGITTLNYDDDPRFVQFCLGFAVPLTAVNIGAPGDRDAMSRIRVPRAMELPER